MVIAKRAGGIVVLVTGEKIVDKLGADFPLPVEVLPYAVEDVQAELLRLGAVKAELRSGRPGKMGGITTENGSNCLLDATFGGIPDELAMPSSSFPAS